MTIANSYNINNIMLNVFGVLTLDTNRVLAGGSYLNSGSFTMVGRVAMINLATHDTMWTSSLGYYNPCQVRYMAIDKGNFAYVILEDTPALTIYKLALNNGRTVWQKRFAGTLGNNHPTSFTLDSQMHQLIVTGYEVKSDRTNGFCITLDTAGRILDTITKTGVYNFLGVPSAYSCFAVLPGGARRAGGGVANTADDLPGFITETHAGAIGCVSQTPEICLVTIDSNRHTVVIWEKPSKTDVANYIIYRALTPSGVFSYQAMVPVDSLSEWTDMTANADSFSYRYKLAVFDLCGQTQSSGKYHQTMRLYATSPGHISWTPYSVENSAGPAISAIELERDTDNSGNWQSIQSMAPSQSTAFDTFFANYPNARYRIAIILTFACQPSRSQTVIYSNIIEKINQPLGIFAKEISAANVLPNPFNDYLEFVNIPGTTSVTICNAVGETVYRCGIQNAESRLSTSGWQQGVYFIQLNHASGDKMLRLVK